MSLLCCVRNCNNGDEHHLDPTAKFFSFPTVRDHQGPHVEELTRRRRMAWVSAVGRPGISFDYVSPLSYVCSRHFHKGQPAYETLDTDPDWVPSLHLGHPQPTNAGTTENTGFKGSKLPTATVKRQRRSLNGPFFVQSECCVVKCGGRSHNDRGQRIRNGLTFYPFPIWRKNDGVFLSDLSKRRRAAWVQAVGRVDITVDNIPEETKVCSRHFVSGKPSHDMREKDPDWVPTLQMNNGQPPFSRKKPTLIKSPKKKRSPKVPDTVSVNREKPSALSWKHLKSHLKGLMMSKVLPMETRSAVDEDHVQNFKNFFRNSLESSLAACLDAGSEPAAERRLSLDLSWFSARQAPLSSGRASAVSAVSCQNCVQLKERITELEERLAAPHFMRDHSDFSTWAQPPSQTSLEPDQRRLSPSPKKRSSPPKARFHLDWLRQHWFLRYSQKQNVMWCHVCRLYSGANQRRSAFVKGTRTFHNLAISQHSSSSCHTKCVKKFRARKGNVK